eukprot:NODE_4518_length_1053_cov_26.355914_g4316_i0.p1 GENE.NODE_4518_length_1053_cov_26.355914_g4316_i0~~NODE_4518_length_1053_cov_26.355914_g4316_i0.p1  ORF type:complete len:261 (+),score=23.63 NODE_4518_length_1053_cov_26.355914_g4316_i0:60-842(+)
MQAACQALAKAYNSRNPPKKVHFISTFMIKRGDEMLTVEPYLKGRYLKHNNNNGFVPPLARSTPQAFSHFTYAHTKGAMLVVDIQGVGDLYTDPQIHCEGPIFGKNLSNLGRKGMESFFGTHQCNAICRYLSLSRPRPEPSSERVSTPIPSNKEASPGIPFRAVEYLHHLTPQKDSVSAPTLALLGLTKETFNGIVDAYRRYDPKGEGKLLVESVTSLAREFLPNLSRALLRERLESFDEGPSFTFKLCVCWIAHEMGQT